MYIQHPLGLVYCNQLGNRIRPYMPQEKHRWWGRERGGGYCVWKGSEVAVITYIRWDKGQTVMPYRFLGQHVIRCQVRKCHNRCTDKDVSLLFYFLPHPSPAPIWTSTASCMQLHYMTLITLYYYDSGKGTWLQIVVPKEAFVADRGLVQPTSRWKIGIRQREGEYSRWNI